MIILLRERFLNQTFLQISWCAMNLALKITNPKSIYHKMLSIQNSSLRVKTCFIIPKYREKLRTKPCYKILLTYSEKWNLYWWMSNFNVSWKCLVNEYLMMIAQWISWEYLMRKGTWVAARQRCHWWISRTPREDFAQTGQRIKFRIFSSTWNCGVDIYLNILIFDINI